EDPAVVVTVSDSTGTVVRRFTAPTTKGINRVAWDLRLPSSNPVDAPPFRPDPNNPFGGGPRGPYAPPGTYQVSLSLRSDSTFTPLGTPQRFRVVDIDSGLPGRTYATIGDEVKAGALQREVLGASALVNDALTRVGYLKRAIDETPGADPALAGRVREMENRLRDARELLSGDPTRARRQEPTSQSLLDRLRGAVGSRSGNSLAPMNAAERAQMDYVRGQFDTVLPKVKQLIDVELKGLEDAAESAGVPWTPGRMPKAP
ncbi:MAG TPA: hypothetical protein VFD85_11150, partial [Gemmatimonadales bacterium]|nr:hypothetical protein [Gemmatimonadales bacterium]